MTKHQVSCTVAGCAICGDHPMEMDITYADTSPPCPSCAALIARIEDVDTLTDKLFANFYPATLSRCRVVAEYLSKWLKEG